MSNKTVGYLAELASKWLGPFKLDQPFEYGQTPPIKVHAAQLKLGILCNIQVTEEAESDKPLGNDVIKPRYNLMLLR